jgi:hypothetical protein
MEDQDINARINAVTCRPVAGQRLGKHNPTTTYTGQQSDNFRCYAAPCKYNNRGSCVFYSVSIYPLLGNGCFLLVRLETI